MKNIFKHALKVTNNTIILTIPLIIFVKLLDLYSTYSRQHLDSTPKFIIASFTLLFMFCVFSAGWFYMVKSAVKLSKKVFILDQDRAKATMGLFKTILDGIGKYFLSFVGASLIYIFIIQLIAAQIVLLLGSKIIGSLDEASLQILQEISSSDMTNMSLLLDKMTPEMIVFFGKWSLLFILVSFVFSYLLILWIPEILYKEINPLKALATSIMKLFTNFFETFSLYLILWLIGFVILFANTFAIINPFTYLLMSIVMFYFFVYIAVTVFLYYDTKYEE